MTVTNANAANVLKIPKHLEADKEAALKFCDMAEILESREIKLRPEDADRLAEYCEAYVLRKRAFAQLAGEQMTLCGPNGASYTNPLLKVISQAEKTLHAVSRLLMLDPLSRKRSKSEIDNAMAQAFHDDDLT